MNILLWVLQGVLAFHTAMGAVWKFTKTPEQTMPSLKAIPPSVWLAMSVVELLCAVALVIPALRGSLAWVVPIAAAIIAAEMLLFCGLHLASGATGYGPMIYWLVVAAICAFVALRRWGG